MSTRDYQDFLSTTRDVFGLDYFDALGLYQQMREVLGYSPDVADLIEYADLASDLVEPAHLRYEEEEFEERYAEEIEAGAMPIPEGRRMEERERPPADLPDDEWLLPGDEIEITAKYEPA